MKMVAKVEKRLVFIFGFLAISTLVLTSIVIVSSLESPAYINNRVRLNINYLLPQGWAFFTRDAREVKTFLYLRNLSDGRLVPLLSSSFQAESYFGLSREKRKIAMEYALSSTEIDSSYWTTFKGNLDSLSRFIVHLKPHQLINKSMKPNFCGEIIAVKRNLTPWAWSSFDNIVQPSQVIRLYVECKNKSLDKLPVH